MLAFTLDPWMRDVIFWVTIIAGVVLLVNAVYRNFRNR
jgi:hypothetical protein